MKSQRKQNIELIIFKNRIKSKSNLTVKPNITYETLLNKLSYLTSQKFRLEIKKSDGITQQLTKERLPITLANYKGEHINVITIPQVTKPQFSTLASPSTSQFIERPKNQQQEMIKALIIPIKQEIKELVNQKLIEKQQTLREGQNLQYNKECSQCRKPLKMLYYLCLKCQNEFILCSQCQQKETYQELNSHKFRAHPFAKIKGGKRKIKSTDILTIQPEYLQFFKKNIQEEQQKIENQQKAEKNIEKSIQQLLKVKLYSNIYKNSI